MCRLWCAPFLGYTLWLIYIVKTEFVLHVHTFRHLGTINIFPAAVEIFLHSCEIKSLDARLVCCSMLQAECGLDVTMPVPGKVY
jgi:hypothetical protein